MDIKIKLESQSEKASHEAKPTPHQPPPKENIRKIPHRDFKVVRCGSCTKSIHLRKGRKEAYCSQHCFTKKHNVVLFEETKRLREELATANATIATKDARIAAKNATIAAKNVTIAAKNATIAAKNATIAAKNTTIAARNETIAARNETIAAKNLDQASNGGGAFQHDPNFAIIPGTSSGHRIGPSPVFHIPYFYSNRGHLT